MYIDSNNVSSLLSSPLQYIPTSGSVTIECQGTGEFDWSEGQGGGASITSDSSQSPRQFNTSSSFRSLVFESFQTTNSGHYTCRSTDGIERTIFVTNGMKLTFLLFNFY